MKAFDLGVVTERLTTRDVEPEFGLIGLFEDETQLRDEFCTRSGDARCAIVRGDRRCTFGDLTAHKIAALSMLMIRMMSHDPCQFINP